MAPLFIIGAGGFGREAYSLLKQCPEWNTRWRFAGFLDDNPGALGACAITPGVVSAIAGFTPRPGDQFVCAIADPRIRLRIARDFSSQGAEFPVVRHPSTVIGENCEVGRGCIFFPRAVLTTSVHLGEFVVVNIGATIGHDARIGDGATLSPHADVTGFAVVGEGAFLGCRASLTPKAKVGAYATVAAGSVVLRRVDAGTTVIGVPAKQVLP